MDITKLLLVDLPMLVGHLTALLTALIVIFTALPGDQPEKTLQKILDFIKGISRK